MAVSLSFDGIIERGANVPLYNASEDFIEQFGATQDDAKTRAT